MAIRQGRQQMTTDLVPVGRTRGIHNIGSHACAVGVPETVRCTYGQSRLFHFSGSGVFHQVGPRCEFPVGESVAAEPLPVVAVLSENRPSTSRSFRDSMGLRAR